MRVKKIILVFFLSLFCVFSISCKKIDKQMQSWVGHHKSKLIREWGPPTRYDSDGLNGEILIYSFQRKFNPTAGKYLQNNQGEIMYTPPKDNSYQAIRMFYVDNEGIIYSWRWQGI